KLVRRSVRVLPALDDQVKNRGEALSDSLFQLAQLVRSEGVEVEPTLRESEPDAKTRIDDVTP
ncbi:MAG: hypothetical protein ACXVGO_17855, partial [Mycobacterium sp.]